MPRDKPYWDNLSLKKCVQLCLRVPLTVTTITLALKQHFTIYTFLYGINACMGRIVTQLRHASESRAA